MNPRFLTTDQLIAGAMSAFRARRGERTIFAGRHKVTTRTPGARVLYLPNGEHVNVTVDDSGTATQIDDGNNLHAIVRPNAITVPLHITRRSRK